MRRMNWTSTKRAHYVMTARDIRSPSRVLCLEGRGSLIVLAQSPLLSLSSSNSSQTLSEWLVK